MKASKRSKPEHNTPSPSEERQGKKPKISDRGSYAQATKGLVRLALVLEGYPDRKLGASEVVLIRKLIKGRILDLSMGAKAPTFTGSWERDGALVFGCADEQTGDWLKSLSSETKIGESSLRALPLDELPRRRRVVVHVDEPDVTVEEAVTLLDKQNVGLAAGEWVVARESVSRDASCAHFACLVGDSSVEALKACNFRPFCGTGRATVRLHDKDRKGESRGVAAQEGAGSG